MVSWITYVYFNIEAIIQLHAHDLVGKRGLASASWAFLIFYMLSLKRKLIMTNRLLLLSLSRVVTTMVLEFRYINVVGNWPLNLDFKKIFILLQSQIKLALNFDTGQTWTTFDVVLTVFCEILNNWLS